MRGTHDEGNFEKKKKENVKNMKIKHAIDAKVHQMMSDNFAFQGNETLRS